jgi:hypothetical protein
MKTSLFKLTDGAEVMARVLSNSDGFVVVEKVRQLILQRDPATGQTTGVAFPPWSNIAGDSELELNKAHIILTLNVIPKALEDAYLTNTSGLVSA